MNHYDIDPAELAEISAMFLIEEIEESREIAKSLRIRDNADSIYKAIAQIKDLIDQEPFHPRPDEIYQGIRDLANNIVNQVEGRP